MRKGSRLRAHTWEQKRRHLDARALRKYLDDALAQADPQAFPMAVGDVARAQKNMSQLARDAGVSRAHLYKALSRKGNISWGVLSIILRELGLQLEIKPRRPGAPLSDL